MKDRLDLYIKNHGIKHWSFAARKDADFMDFIEKASSNYSDLPFAQKVYCAVNEEDPYCHRGNLKRFKSIQSGLGFCGRTGECKCASEHISHMSKNSDHVERLKKTKATLLERYGTDNFGQTPSARAAHHEFYKDKQKVTSAIEKGKQTMLDKYGVDNALKLIDHISRKQTSRSRFNLSKEAALILDEKDKFEEFISNKSVCYAANILGVSESTITNYSRKYGVINSNSSYENEISFFLKNHEISFLYRNRNIAGCEMDFVIDDHKLMIEFNGIYWHTEDFVDQRYHRNKYELANRSGYKLLMINSDEYDERPDAIRKKILNLCGLSERGVGARKLKIQDIDISTAKSFVSTHHIQGHTSTVWRAFGAFDGNDLCAVVILGKQRSTGMIELTRFCTSGKTYAGLMSRFLSYIRKTITEDIVTFADLRYSDGNLYRVCGFEEIQMIPPDYRYVWRGKTYHKSLFTKKRIAKKFSIDMSQQTERSAMYSLGYRRIYDCGKIKFIHRAIKN